MQYSSLTSLRKDAGECQMDLKGNAARSSRANGPAESLHSLRGQRDQKACFAGPNEDLSVNTWGLTMFQRRSL